MPTYSAKITMTWKANKIEDTEKLMGALKEASKALTFNCTVLTVSPAKESD